MLNILNPIESEITEAVEALMAGESLEKFQLLGEGISGSVYQYQDSPYAIKVMKENAKETADPFILSALQQTNSKAFPTLYAYEEGKVMVSEVIHGKTIYQIDGKNGDLLNEYRKELRKAKEAAISVGLIPSDVHLNNMMITETGEFKIVDVGNFKPVGFQDTFHMMGWFSHSSHSSSHRHHHHRRSSNHRHGHRHSSSHRHHRHHHHHSYSSGASISSVISEIFSFS